MRFLFEIGLSFPNGNKKQSIIINALFPIIVMNTAVRIYYINLNYFKNLYLDI